MNTLAHPWAILAGLGLFTGGLVDPWVESHLRRRQVAAGPEPVPIRFRLLSPLSFLMAALFVVLVAALGTSPRLLPALLLTTILAVAAFTDIRARIIPNHLLLWGAGAWVLTDILGPTLPPLWSLVGALAGGGGMLVLSIATRGGIGLGDAKLAAVMGLILGPAALAVALGTAFFLGALASGVLLVLRRVHLDSYIPLAPFLLAGGLVAFVAATTVLGPKP